MTKLQGVVEVCTFCYDAHQHYAKNQPFNLAQKQAVQICCCCKENMCRQCVEHSHVELEGSILAQYGFEICRLCIATVRRSNAMKPRLEKAVREAVEDVRVRMEMNIYMITHEPA